MFTGGLDWVGENTPKALDWAAKNVFQINPNYQPPEVEAARQVQLDKLNMPLPEGTDLDARKRLLAEADQLVADADNGAFRLDPLTHLIESSPDGRYPNLRSLPADDREKLVYEARTQRAIIAGERGAGMVNGSLQISPAMAWDTEGLTQAIESTPGATPEQKSEALARLPRLKAQAAAVELPFFQQLKEFNEFLSKNTNLKTPEEQIGAFKGRDIGPQEWAGLLGTQAKLGLSQGYEGLIQQTQVGVGVAAQLAKEIGGLEQAGPVADAMLGAALDFQGPKLEELSKTSQNVGGYPQVAEFTSAATSMVPPLLAGGGISMLGAKGAGLAVSRMGLTAEETALVTAKAGSNFGFAGSVGVSGLQSAAQVFAQATDMAEQRYIEQGMSPEKARVKAMHEAYVPSILSGISTAVVTAVGGKQGAESVFRIADLRQMTTNQALRQTIRAFGKELAKDFKQEFKEESVDQLIQGIVAQATYNPDMKIGEIVSQAWQAGVYGGLLGGAMSGGKFAVDYTKMSYLHKGVRERYDLVPSVDMDEALSAHDEIQRIADLKDTSTIAAAPENIAPADRPALAQAVVKVARGATLDSLLPAERTAIETAKTAGGDSFLQAAEEGSPAKPSETAINWLGSAAPQAIKLIYLEVLEANRGRQKAFQAWAGENGVDIAGPARAEAAGKAAMSAHLATADSSEKAGYSTIAQSMREMAAIEQKLAAARAGEAQAKVNAALAAFDTTPEGKAARARIALSLSPDTRSAASMDPGSLARLDDAMTDGRIFNNLPEIDAFLAEKPPSAPVEADSPTPEAPQLEFSLNDKKAGETSWQNQNQNPKEKAAAKNAEAPAAAPGAQAPGVSPLLPALPTTNELPKSPESVAPEVSIPSPEGLTGDQFSAVVAQNRKTTEDYIDNLPDGSHDVFDSTGEHLGVVNITRSPKGKRQVSYDSPDGLDNIGGKKEAAQALMWDRSTTADGKVIWVGKRVVTRAKQESGAPAKVADIINPARDTEAALAVPTHVATPVEGDITKDFSLAPTVTPESKAKLADWVNKALTKGATDSVENTVAKNQEILNNPESTSLDRVKAKAYIDVIGNARKEFAAQKAEQDKQKSEAKAARAEEIKAEKDRRRLAKNTPETPERDRAKGFAEGAIEQLKRDFPEYAELIEMNRDAWTESITTTAQKFATRLKSRLTSVGQTGDTRLSNLEDQVFSGLAEEKATQAQQARKTFYGIIRDNFAATGNPLMALNKGKPDNWSMDSTVNNWTKVDARTKTAGPSLNAEKADGSPVVAEPPAETPAPDAETMSKEEAIGHAENNISAATNRVLNDTLGFFAGFFANDQKVSREEAAAALKAAFRSLSGDKDFQKAIQGMVPTRFSEAAARLAPEGSSKLERAAEAYLRNPTRITKLRDKFIEGLKAEARPIAAAASEHGVSASELVRHHVMGNDEVTLMDAILHGVAGEQAAHGAVATGDMDHVAGALRSSLSDPAALRGVNRAMLEAGVKSGISPFRERARTLMELRKSESWGRDAELSLEELCKLDADTLEEAMNSSHVPENIRILMRGFNELTGGKGLDAIKRLGPREAADFVETILGPELAQGTDVNLLNVPMKSQGLFWSRRAGTILVNPLLGRRQWAWTAIHETVHALTGYKIDAYLRGDHESLTPKELGACQELERLAEIANSEAQKRFADAKEKGASEEELQQLRRDLLGTSDKTVNEIRLGEFVSEAMNHEPFQKFLEELTDTGAHDGPDTEKVSVWRKMLNAILVLVRGKDVAMDSLLQKVWENGVKLANNTDRATSDPGRNAQQAEWLAKYFGGPEMARRILAGDKDALAQAQEMANKAPMGSRELMQDFLNLADGYRIMRPSDKSAPVEPVGAAGALKAVEAGVLTGEFTPGDYEAQKIATGGPLESEAARAMTPRPDLQIDVRRKREDAGTFVDGREMAGLSFGELKSHPKLLARMVDKIVSHGVFRIDGRAKSPEAKAEHIVNQMADNLKFIYDQVPSSIRERSKGWYKGANKIAHFWSDKYDVPVQGVAGAIAALSPQRDWYMNVSLAERVLDIATGENRKTDVVTNEMISNAERIDSKQEGKDVEIEGVVYPYAAFADAARRLQKTGLAFDEMNPGDKALFIRLYDETYNPANFTVVTPEGDFGRWQTTSGGKGAMTTWGPVQTIQKALEIIQNPSAENISRQLGGQHKIRSFYNNIINPLSDHVVTVDTHAVAAAYMLPLSGTSPEVTANFSGVRNAEEGFSGTYALIAEAYRRAAAEKGVSPSEMQSITWEAIREIYTAGFKQKAANKDAVRKLWDDYVSKKDTYENTRQRAFDAGGGYALPQWYQQPEFGLLDSLGFGTGDSTYQAASAGESIARIREGGRRRNGRNNGRDNAGLEQGDGRGGVQGDLFGASVAGGKGVAQSETSTPELFRAIKENPEGFTLDPTTAELESKGWVVAPSKKTEFRIAANQFTPETLRAYLYAMRPLFEDGAKVGGWLNKKDERFYLDAVHIVDNPKDAAILARDGQQLAVFHLDKFQEHETNQLLQREGISDGDAARPDLRAIRERYDRGASEARILRTYDPAGSDSFDTAADTAGAGLSGHDAKAFSAITGAPLQSEPANQKFKTNPELGKSPQLVYNDQYGEPSNTASERRGDESRDPASSLGVLRGDAGAVAGGAGQGARGPSLSKRVRALAPESQSRRDAEKLQAERKRVGLADMEALEKWADKNDRVLNADMFRRTVMKGRKALGDGSEHTTVWDKPTDRVIKWTHGDDFGNGAVGQALNVGDYIQNLKDANDLFNIGNRVEGIVYLDNKLPQVVISQPKFSGDKATLEQIASFFGGLGFRQADSGAWVREKNGERIEVWDAVPDNVFVKTLKSGKLVTIPFDVQISRESVASAAPQQSEPSRLDANGQEVRDNPYVPTFRPKVFKADERAVTQALDRVRSTPEFANVKAALAEKTYFPETAKETTEIAHQYLAEHGDNYKDAFEQADSTPGVTPMQAIVIRGLVLKRVAKAENAARAAAVETTDASRRSDLLTLADNYHDQVSYFASRVADAHSAWGQEGVAMRVIAALLPANQITVRLYKNPIMQEQAEALDNNPAAQEIVKGIQRAKAGAATNTTSRLQAVFDRASEHFIKKDAPGATPEELAAAQEKARQCSSPLPVREQVKRAAMEEAVVQGMTLIENAMTEEQKNSPEGQSFLREWQSRLRKEASDQLDNYIAERLKGGKIDEPTTPEMTDEEKAAAKEERINDAWRSVGDLPLAEQVFNQARATIEAADTPYSGLVKGLKFDNAKSEGLRRAVKASISLPQEIRKFLGGREQSIKMLVARLIEANPSLTEEQANSLSDATEAVYNEQVELAAKAELDRMVKASKNPGVRKALDNEGRFARLLSLSNLGAFNREDSYNALAPAFGLPAWDMDTAKRLEEDATALQKLPEGSLGRGEAGQRLMQDIAKAHVAAGGIGKKAAYTLQVVAGVWIAHTLSGPVTHAVNLTATQMSIFTEAVAEANGYRIAAIKGGATKEQASEFAKDILRAYAYTFGKDAMGTSVRAFMEAERAMGAGVNRFHTAKMDSLGVLEGYKFDDKVADPTSQLMLALSNKDWKTAAVESGNMVGGIAKTMAERVATVGQGGAKGALSDLLATQKMVGRALLAQDAINSTLARNMKMFMAQRYSALMEPKPEGVSQDVWDAKMNAKLDAIGKEALQEVKEQAVAQATSEEVLGGFGQKGTREFNLNKARRVEQIIEQKTYGSDLLVSADSFAARATYNNEFEGYVGLLTNTLFGPDARQAFGGLGSVLTPLNPFSRVGASIINQAITFSPYGFLRAEGKSASDTFLPENSKFRRTAPEPGSPEYYAMRSKAFAGTAVMSGVAVLVALAVKAAWDDKDKKEPFWFALHGAGPSDPVLNKQWKAAGNIPYSLRVGSATLRYQDIPHVSIVLGMLGEIHDRMIWDRKENHDDKTLADRLGNALLGSIGVTTSRTLLSGLSAVAAVLSSNGTDASRQAAFDQLKASYGTGLTNPSLFRFMQSAVTGKTYDAKTWEGWALQFVPMGQAIAGRPKLNILGEPITKGLYEQLFDRLLPQVPTKHPVLSPLTEAGLRVNTPQQYAVVDPSTQAARPITPEEFYRFSELYGKNMAARLSPALVNNLTALASQRPQAAQDRLDKIALTARNQAQAQLREELGVRKDRIRPQ
jgi:hypothetical protein